MEAATSKGKPGRPSRRRYAQRMPAAERREQLLDATLELISRHGYGGASMEAIAREAGVTKPVVYDAFGDRGSLLRALLEREEQRALGAFAGVLPDAPSSEDPDAVLERGVVTFLEVVRSNPAAWRLILMPVDGTPAEVREHVERGRAVILDQLRELMEWGIRKRGGPSGLDAELAAHGILAFGEQTARLALTEPDRFPPERVGKFAAALLAGLARD
jgi:AcrR family transcriptional regulator